MLQFFTHNNQLTDLKMNLTYSTECNRMHNKKRQGKRWVGGGGLEKTHLAD